MTPTITIPGSGAGCSSSTAAASPTLTLKVMLILMGVLLPVMLIYNGYQYRVFRGKTPKEGYGAYDE